MLLPSTAIRYIVPFFIDYKHSSMEKLQLALDSLLDDIQPLIGKGKVANYIPALAKVEPNQFGIAICDLKGNTFTAGDAAKPFSIQSISKLFTLVQALTIYGDDLWNGLGKDPSGSRFNSLVQLETESGIPRNPFINAGALLVCDRLESRLSTPNFQLLEWLRKLSANPKIYVNKQVAQSEIAHGARNAAMAYLMQAFANFHNPVETVLKSYAHHCAIEMSCIDLARACLFLANSGKALDGTEVVSPKRAKRINSLLATCGLYDAAGEFAFRVGLPGKSGVGGGIVAVYPHNYTICVWSPSLNSAGNSLAGVKALEKLSDQLKFSIF